MIHLPKLRLFLSLASGLLVFGSSPLAQNAAAYHGSHINAFGFENVVGPVIGQDWTTSVALAPRDVASFVLVSSTGPAPPGSRPGGIFGEGELLLQPPLLLLGRSSTGQHSFTIRDDPSLIGFEFAAQAGTVSLSAEGDSITLQNALLLSIGWPGGPVTQAPPIPVPTSGGPGGWCSDCGAW